VYFLMSSGEVEQGSEAWGRLEEILGECMVERFTVVGKMFKVAGVVAEVAAGVVAEVAAGVVMLRV